VKEVEEGSKRDAWLLFLGLHAVLVELAGSAKIGAVPVQQPRIACVGQKLISEYSEKRKGRVKRMNEGQEAKLLITRTT
jgi:hypothetical protein